MKEVTTPTLILHDEADSRVPISQSLELYHALKRQDVEVQMAAYPRMPHTPSEPWQYLDIMRRSLNWFNRFLGPNRETPSAKG